MAAFSHNGEPGSALDAELRWNDIRHREGYAAGFKAGREAGMWEAATDARLIDWLEKALFAKSWNAVIDSGSRTHWRIVEGHRHITAKMEGATFRDAILSAIEGAK